MTAERLPVLLADGPRLRASAARPLLDAAGFLSRPFRGERQGPALILVDPERHDARALLEAPEAESQLRAVALPEDSRLLQRCLDQAAQGLGQPDLAQAAQITAIVSELSGLADLNAVLRLVTVRARQLVDAEGATVFLVDYDQGELVVRAAEGGTGVQLVETRSSLGQGIAGSVVQSLRPLLVNAPAEDPRFDATNDRRTGFVTRNLAAVPIFWHGRLVGVLEAVNRNGGPFSEADLRALVTLAQHVGIAVNHTRAAEALVATAWAARQRSQDLETLVRERTDVLTRAKREWEQTFDAIAEPMAVMDGFVIRRANKAYARRAGLLINEVPGRTCYRLLGRTAPCPNCPLARTPPGTNGEVELHSGRLEAISGFALADGGTIAHYRDVTLERALEAKLRAVDRLAAVGQLAAGAAHEINNPVGFVSSNLVTLSSYLTDLAGVANRAALAGRLAAVGDLKGAAALFVSDEVDVDIEETVTEVMALVTESRSGLERVTNIVRALKELAKQEVQTAPERVSVSTLVDTVRRQLAPLHPKVRASWRHRTDVPVVCQPLHVERALAAVVKNALQAAQQGGGNVELSVEAMGSEVRVTVADDGPGIPDSIRMKVFEPFFTTRGVGGGVGLGLTAAYGIVARHGGRIELVPRQGGGTLAVIVFPAAANAPESALGLDESAA
ncbi:MAG: GAF domain-containing protein [Deltaproteobacteria bacterium]|nr:GAF domain-containing protein [Deltaproteobacteria bacterium]